MKEVSILGVGTSHFGWQPGLTHEELGWAAISEALLDANGPSISEIEAVYVGTVLAPNGTAQRVLRAAGMSGIPCFTLESACASGAIAYEQAIQSVRSGQFKKVLALGVEKMSAVFDGAIHPEMADTDGRSGLALPGHYAMAASRYLATGMVTLQQLAAVAVKNRGNAVHNPRAQFSGIYSIDEVLDSRMIADPLTLLQCCPISDGAAAAVIGLSSSDPRQIKVRGIARGSGGLWDHRCNDVWSYRLVESVSKAAYAEANISSVSDIDVLEVHDAFTISEISTTEALGLVKQGGGGELAESGITKIEGAFPVNPSGGLLARGHPLGATGIAQLVEIVWQLRGVAGVRQVAGARIGVVETMGGGTSGVDGNACVVAVLSK